MSGIYNTRFNTESSANKLRHTYVKGYVDISGGDLNLQNGTFTMYNGKTSSAYLSIQNDGRMWVTTTAGQLSDFSLSNLLFLNTLNVNADDTFAVIKTRINGITHNSDFVVDDTLIGNGGLTVTGTRFKSDNNALFLSDVSINGILNANNDVSFNSRLFVGRDVSLGQHLYVVGDVSFNSNLFVGKDVSLGQRLYVVGDASFNSNLFVGNDVSLGKRLYVVGDASLNSNLFVGKDVSLGQRLYVVGDASFNSNLFVGKDVSFGQRLYVVGDLSLNSNLYANGTNSTFKFLPSYNGAGGTNPSVTDNNFVIKSQVDYYIDTSMTWLKTGNNSWTGNNYYSNDVNMGSRLFVYKDVSFGGNLFLVNDASLNSKLFVNGDASFNGNFFLGKDASFGGNMFVKLDSSFNGNLTIGKRLNLNGDASFNSNLFVGNDASFGQKMLVIGDVSFNSNFTVAGNVKINNSLSFKIDDTNYINGETSQGNAVNILPLTSVVKISGIGSNIYYSLADGYFDGQTIRIFSNRVGVNGLKLYGKMFFDQSLNRCEPIIFKNAYQSFDAIWSAGAWIVTAWKGVNFTNSSMIFGTAGAGDIEMNAAGKLYVNSPATIVNDATLNANLFVMADTSLNSRLYVAGNTLLNGDLSLNSNLYVNGNTKFMFLPLFNGASSTPSDPNNFVTKSYVDNAGSSLITSNNSWTGNNYFVNDVSFNSNLFVYKDASLNSKLFVGSDVSLNSKLFVKGDVSLNSKLFVASDVSLNSKLFVASDVSMNSKLIVGNDVSLNSKLFVSGTSNLVGKLIVDDDVSLNNNLYIKGNASATRFNGKNGGVSSFITWHDGDIFNNSSSLFYGIGTIANHLTFSANQTEAVATVTPSMKLSSEGDLTISGNINGINVGRGAENSPTNISIGYQALNTSGPVQSVAVGYQALNKASAIDYNNDAFGFQALFNCTTGFNNTGIGYNALTFVTAASHNTAIGRNAGNYDATNAYNFQGNSNTFLGAYTGMDGNWTNSTAVGINAIITGNNQIKLGTNSDTVQCGDHLILKSSNDQNCYIRNNASDKHLYLGTGDKNFVQFSNSGSINNTDYLQIFKYTNDEFYIKPMSGNLNLGGGNLNSLKFTTNNAATFYGNVTFTVSPTSTATQPLSSDATTIIPTTAWVQSAITAAASSGGAIENPYNGDLEISGNFYVTNSLMIGQFSEMYESTPSYQYLFNFEKNTKNYGTAQQLTFSQLITYSTDCKVGNYSAIINPASDFNSNQTILFYFGNFFSICFWIKFNSINNLYKIIQFYNNASDKIDMYMNGSNISININGSGGVVSTTTAFSTGTWYHIGVTISATTAIIYVNGSLNASGTINQFSYNSKILYIASESGADANYLNILIDQLIFDNNIAPFSATAISNIYNSNFNLNLTSDLKVIGDVEATSYNATSDYRIKENVTILDATFNVDSLEPVTYNLKGSGKKDIGFIAHEVQELYPFLVNGIKDGPVNQSINYNGFIGILTKEIKNLKSEMRLLRDANTKLASDISILLNLANEVSVLRDIVQELMPLKLE